jgi:hypothetical protein
VSDEAIEKCMELAAELREIAQDLTDHRVGVEAATAALELARAMRPHLRGERRPRWYEIAEPPPFGSTSFGPFDTLSPVRGVLNSVAPPLRMEFGEREDGTRCVIGHACLSQVYEGPPYGVHGGIVAAMFDEILGSAQGLAPPPGVTAKLEVFYHQLTPIDEDLRFEAWLTSDRGRRVFAEATCHAGETLTARASGLFMRVDFKAVEERMQARTDGEET